MMDDDTENGGEELEGSDGLVVVSPTPSEQDTTEPLYVGEKEAEAAGLAKVVTNEIDADLDEEMSDEAEEDFDSSDDGDDNESGDEDNLHDDPLGEAYDLECGDVLEPNVDREPRANWKTKLASPKEFFNTEILYRYDILEDVDREILKGKYRIELKGYQGGVWTVALNDQVEVLNRAEDADVVFSMQQRDFIDLINGQLNPQLAMLSKKIRVSGDVKRAIHFQSLLSPSFD